jgi:hypothetical protein
MRARAEEILGRALVAKEFNEEDHPRDEHGRFTNGSTSGVDVPNLSRNASEGFTVDPFTGKAPTTGYMVARSMYGEIVKTNNVEDTAKALRAYADKHAHVFAEDPSLYLGGWRDKATGQFYLDVCDNVSDREKAVELGANRDQKAIFHLDTFDEIPTGGTGEGNGRRGFDRNPDEIYGTGTVVRKSAGELFSVVGRGEGRLGYGGGSKDSFVLKEFDESQHPRDAHGRFAPAETHDAIDNATSTSELGDILRSHFGYLELTGFGNRNLSVDKVKDLTRSLVDLRSQFPQAKITGITIKNLPEHVGAQTRTTVNRYTGQIADQEIVMNTKMVNKNDSEFFDSLWAESRDKGYSMRVPESVSMIEANLTHEYAHALDYSRPNGARSALPVYSIASEMVKDPQSPSYGERVDDVLKTQTSEYGRTSERERVAEAFVDTRYNGENAYPLSREITARLIAEGLK